MLGMFECIYCFSKLPPTKREHVMSQALGTFEQNWTLDCVCDQCNEYFANNLELALGRDSREALLRLELGLKPPSGAAQLLQRRVKASLQEPGQFDGMRLLIRPSDDGTDIGPVPLPQVGLMIDGDEEWTFLVERELTPNNLRRFVDAESVRIKIFGVGAQCDLLRQKLEECGIGFREGDRVLDQPVSSQSRISVQYDINNDVTIVRAACKIGFNYAARIIGCEVVKSTRFDGARRFVRYGEEPVRMATAQQLSILVGSDAESSKIHACGLGWNNGFLVVVVSLFNELTYGLRLCEASPTEFARAQHFFDPWTRRISEAPIGE